MKKETVWDKLLIYIRNKNIGEEFTRTELLKETGSFAKRKHLTTADNYKKLLMACGYLESCKSGVYRKIRPVSMMTYKLALDKAYTKTWKTWFLEEVDPK